MKLKFLFLLIAFLFSVVVQAQPLIAFVSYGTFKDAGNEPYMELYLKVPYGSLHFSESGIGKYKSGVNVECYLFKSLGGNRDSMVLKDRFTIFSPHYQEPAPKGSLVDLHRYAVSPGNYRLEVYLQDYFDTVRIVSAVSPASIVFDDKPSFSSIMLVDSVYPAAGGSRFSRNDFNYMPTVINLFQPGRKELEFYTEFYDRQPTGILEIKYAIKDKKGLFLPNYHFSHKKADGRIVPFFEHIDISSLPAGDYSLAIEMDAEGKMLNLKETSFRIAEKSERKDFAMRLSNEQIRAFVPNLYPILEKKDLAQYEKAQKDQDTIALKEWFAYFWQKRNPELPEQAYKEYCDRLYYVKAAFSTLLFRSGVGSDRGRTYLKYGKPDYISPYLDEPTAYPYEIWQYYHLETQSNVKFVFYNPTGIENEYRLLHSDLRNEVSNPNWKKEIYRRTNKNTNIDSNNPPNDWGNHLNDRLKE